MGHLFFIMRSAVAAILFALIVLSLRAPTSQAQSPRQLAATQSSVAASQRSRLQDRPIVHWPVRRDYQRLYPDRVVVLEAVFPGSAPSWRGLAVTYSGRELEALDAVSGRPVWPRPVACPVEPTLLQMDENRLVFMTRYRVFALTAAGGTIAWQVGEELSEDRNVDWESAPSWTDRFMTERGLLVVSSAGELLCIDPRDGSIRWQCHIGKDAYTGLIADDRFVYYAERQAEGNVVNVLDAESGERVRAIDAVPEGRVDAIRTLSCGNVVVILGQRFVWIDAVAGKGRSWLRLEAPVQLSTVQCDGIRLFMASNRGSVLRIGITIPMLADASFERKQKSEQTWTTISGDDFYVAWDRALMVFDAGASLDVVGPPLPSGSELKPKWRIDNIPAFTRWPPMLTANAILTIEADDKERGGAAETQPTGSQPDAASRFRLRGFRRADGKEVDITRDGPLRTEPLRSFAGLAVRDGAIIVLDGNRLIGYVGDR